MTISPDTIRTCTPFELELVRAVARAAGLDEDLAVTTDGTTARISNRCAVALIEAASDIVGSIGDTGAWVDEAVTALAGTVSETLGSWWRVAADGVVVCAAVDASGRFDQLAVAALLGPLQVVGRPVAEDVASYLGPDIAWLC